MKFSSAILCLSMSMTSAISSSKMAISSRSSMAKVLSKARRLEENAAEEEGEYDFLQKFTLKLVSCATGEHVVDAENGEYENNAVTVRMCPTENSCDSSSMKGCSAGYGDYIVGLNTYVNAYLEEQKKQMEKDGNDNQNGDDDFEIERYSECREYEVEEDGENGDDVEQAQYFIGPACSADGFDIKLALFTDDACLYSSDVAFEDISNGWELPYASGGMVSFNCINCMDYNEDQGAYELREMCENIYQSTQLKCEEKMEYYSAVYGQDNTNCEYVEALMPSKVSGSGNAGKVFGWLIFVVVIVGLIGYVMWWRKKKAASSNASDGQMA